MDVKKVDIDLLEKSFAEIRKRNDSHDRAALNGALIQADIQMTLPIEYHALAYSCILLGIYLAVGHSSELLAALRTYQAGLDKEIPF